MKCAAPGDGMLAWDPQKYPRPYGGIKVRLSLDAPSDGEGGKAEQHGFGRAGNHLGVGTGGSEVLTGGAEDDRVHHDPKGLPYDPEVRVVRLTAPSPRASETAGEKRRAYHHRWPVRMHKVRQWSPSRQEHRVIWRGPYIKGPADAPLMMGEKAYLVDS